MDKDDLKDTGCAGLIGYMTITLVTLAFAATFNGWILAKLWAMIIVPTFHLAPLTVAQAVGLNFLYGFMKMKPSADSGKNDKSLSDLLVNAMISTVAGGFAVLGMVYLVTLFM